MTSKGNLIVDKSWVIPLSGAKPEAFHRRKNSQLTVRVLVARNGSTVAGLVALQRYSAWLSSGFRMNEICFDTMLPVTRVEPRISLSPENKSCLNEPLQVLQSQMAKTSKIN